MMLTLLPTPAGLAAALQATARDAAASLPLLDTATTRELLQACDGLAYRAARPLVGAAGQEVRQDFELTMAIPPLHPLRSLAAALAALTGRALALSEPPLLPGDLEFNDLIVQRYEIGSVGITPHRDHLRYVGLVVLVTLAGRAELVLCDDRAGSNPRAFPMAPGVATLMRAPGFAGEDVRPFHYVTALREARVSVGLRHDTRPGQPT